MATDRARDATSDTSATISFFAAKPSATEFTSLYLTLFVINYSRRQGSQIDTKRHIWYRSTVFVIPESLSQTTVCAGCSIKQYVDCESSLTSFTTPHLRSWTGVVY